MGKKSVFFLLSNYERIDSKHASEIEFVIEY